MLSDIFNLQLYLEKEWYFFPEKVIRRYKEHLLSQMHNLILVNID